MGRVGVPVLHRTKRGPVSVSVEKELSRTRHKWERSRRDERLGPGGVTVAHSFSRGVWRAGSRLCPLTRGKCPQRLVPPPRCSRHVRLRGYKDVRPTGLDGGKPVPSEPQPRKPTVVPLVWISQGTQDPPQHPPRDRRPASKNYTTGHRPEAFSGSFVFCECPRIP